MNMIQLLQNIGIDNIGYQNLANSCSGGTANKKGEITYKLVTDQPIFDVLMAKTKTGLVLWVDTDKMEAALKAPIPQTVTVTIHDQYIYEYDGGVFVVFAPPEAPATLGAPPPDPAPYREPTTDTPILGSCRTLAEAQEILAKFNRGEGAACGLM